MKNAKKFLAAILLVASVSVFSGCNLLGSNLAEPEKTAAEVISEGIANLTKAQSMSYEVKLVGEGTSPDTGVINYDFAVEGIVNEKDPASTHFSMGLSGNGKMGEQSGDIDAEVRMIGDNAYILVEKLPEIAGAEGVFDTYMDTWWTLPADAGVTNVDLPMFGSVELTADEQQTIDDLKSASFFENLEYVGSETAGGVDSFYYKGMMDKEAALDFMMEVGDMTEEERAEAEETMDQLTFEAEVWIGAEDMIFRKVAGTLVIVGEGENLNTTVSLELSDLNADLSVETPSDTKELDPMMLLPLMMMGSGLSGDTTVPEYVEGDFDGDGVADPVVE